MRYVILGSSAAGVSGAKELRRLDPDAKILLVSTDEEIYSRCILHHFLGNTRTKAELSFVEPDFEKRHRIDWIKGTTCTGVDASGKKVTLSDGSEVAFDKLLIATGAHTFLPPIPGLTEARNVIGFRNIDDIERLQKEAAKAEHIVIAGGGLVGLDALTGLLHLGKKPALIEIVDKLLPKQLDHRSSSSYEKAFQKEGAVLYLGHSIEQLQLDESGMIRKLSLSGGLEISCDLLVMTAGVRANVEFLEGSGIKTDRMGLVIDAEGKTNVPDIYGAGDVTGKSPIWPAAVKEGLVAAANMTGERRRMTDFFASKATMNFLGIPTMSLGVSEKPDETYEEEIDDQGEIYRKVIHKNGKIYGAILQGDLSYAGVLTQLIAGKIDVSKVRKPLFQIDYSDFFHIDDNFEFYYEEDENE